MAIRADITERKRGEEVRERLAAVVESSDDAIIGKTLDGTITAWNHGAENVFGYSATEAIGKSMRMLIPPERASEERDILARVGRGQSVEHFDTVRVRKDGKRIEVSATISPIKDSSGAIVGASKIARDVTERKLPEETLKKSLATSDAALKELANQKFALDQHAIVAITDVQGTITYVNHKLGSISQYSKDELIGQNHRILNSGHIPKSFSSRCITPSPAGRFGMERSRTAPKTVRSTGLVYRRGRAQGRPGRKSGTLRSLSTDENLPPEQPFSIPAGLTVC